MVAITSSSQLCSHLNSTLPSSYTFSVLLFYKRDLFYRIENSKNFERGFDTAPSRWVKPSNPNEPSISWAIKPTTAKTIKLRIYQTSIFQFVYRLNVDLSIAISSAG
jgi:hypothetical protein